MDDIDPNVVVNHHGVGKPKQPANAGQVPLNFLQKDRAFFE